MNKFLKGTVACAAIVPCLMGLTACDDNDKPKAYTGQDAYNEVFGQVNNLVTKMADIQTPGKEFQLNVNLSINYQTIIANAVSAENSFAARVRAAIGARHSEDNKELFGNIGFVDGDGVFTSLLNAYMADDVDNDATKDADEEFEVVVPTANDWNLYKGVVYVLDGEEYVLAGDTFDAEVATSNGYYMKSTDLMHIYMASTISDIKKFELTETQPADWADEYDSYYTKGFEYAAKKPSATYATGVYYNSEYQLVEGDQPADWATGTYYTKEVVYTAVEGVEPPAWEVDTYYAQTGIDINGLLADMGVEFEIPEGEMYAFLNTGDEIVPELPGDDPAQGNMLDSLDDILGSLTEMDYNAFIESLELPANATVVGEKANGNSTLKIVADGTTMKFTARADGGITLSVTSTILGEGYSTVMSMTLDIDLEDEIDESYIPTNLEDYGDDPVDLEELLASLMGGNE